MGLIVQPAPSGVQGVDTIVPFTPAMALRIKEAGYSFVVRYLGAIHPPERDAILGAGLGLLAVGYSRRPGWSPSAEIGASDGTLAVARANEAGLLAKMSLYCDLEGPASSTTAADCIGYVNAWAKPILDAGFTAGLYVGYGVPLTPLQFYHDLNVTGYWHSCSSVPDVAVRGYQMFQGNPPNQVVAGISVDIDTIRADNNGDTPSWMISVPGDQVA